MWPSDRSGKGQPKFVRLPWRERIGTSEVIVVAIGYFLFSSVGNAFVEAFGYEPLSPSGLPLSVIVSVVAAVSSFGLVLALPTKSTFGSIGLGRTSGRWLVAGIGLGLLAWIASFALGTLHSLVVGDSSSPRPELTNALAQGTALQVALLTLLACSLVPLAEELLFRGVLYTWLRRWGIVLAVTVSSVIFGLFHGGGAILFSSAALGVIAALAYERSGSLWPAVVAHATMNTTMAVVGAL